MKKNIAFLTLILSLLTAALNVQPARAANAVVGSGTSASCTETAFDAALVTASSGGGTITFNCGAAVATINITSQKNILTNNITINGNDRIVLNGGSVTRHFFVNDGLTFRLQHIILRDGDSAIGGGAIEMSGAHVFLEYVQVINNYAPNQGGGIYCYVGVDGTLNISDSLFENNVSRYGGAIFNDGCVTTISNSTFKTNQATNGIIGTGGAIYNSTPFTPALHTLTVNNSLFQGNSALDGGGLYNDTGASATLNTVTLKSNTGGYGGGVENSGTVTLNDSLVDANIVTGSGGGIWNMNGIVNLVRTTISNNSAYEGGGINTYGTHLQMTNVNIVGNVAAGSHGGGIYHGGGTAFITNATVSGNQANDSAANGGGIYQRSNDNLTLTNVTLANNQAGLLGGGFYHYGRYAILTNVTIANNIAGAAGNAIYEDSPMTPADPGVVQLTNSVILGSANNCDGSTFDTLGYNLSIGTCSALNSLTDQENYAGNLNLGALALNGGAFTMQTMQPLTGSPLIDAGNNGACPATDQRGVTRPIDGDHNSTAICDIGAYETSGYYFIYLPLIVR